MSRPDLDEIKAWLREQETASDFGGTCEFDHDGAENYIDYLVSEVERLNYRLDTLRHEFGRMIRER